MLFVAWLFAKVLPVISVIVPPKLLMAPAFSLLLFLNVVLFIFSIVAFGALYIAPAAE